MSERRDIYSDEEKVRMAVEFDAIERLVKLRHGTSIAELAEAARWVKAHRDWVEAMKRGGSLALIGFFASGLLLALWEGLKLMVRRG